MIADRSNPVRTVSRTKWATCPEGTKSWIDGGSSQTWSTSQARNVLLIPRLNHDAPSSSRKIRLLGQAPSCILLRVSPLNQVSLDLFEVALLCQVVCDHGTQPDIAHSKRSYLCIFRTDVPGCLDCEFHLFASLMSGSFPGGHR